MGLGLMPSQQWFGSSHSLSRYLRCLKPPAKVGDGQAKASAAKLTRIRVVALAEGVKETSDSFRRDTDACVTNYEM